MFERATRLWAMSPQMVTTSPSMLPLVGADGRAVEQRLGGVLVGAVAGVDHRGPQRLRQHQRRAGLGVADDHHVRAHGVEVAGGVQQGLALGGRRGAARDVHRVGRQPLGGDLERCARARRRLEEQVDHRLAPQGGHLLDRAAGDLQEALAQIQDGGQRLGADSPSVPSRCRAETRLARAHAFTRSRSTTRSGSPFSLSITRTDWSAVVCTRTPT